MEKMMKRTVIISSWLSVFFALCIVLVIAINRAQTEVEIRGEATKIDREFVRRQIERRGGGYWISGLHNITKASSVDRIQKVVIERKRLSLGLKKSPGYGILIKATRVLVFRKSCPEISGSRFEIILLDIEPLEVEKYGFGL